MRFDLAHVLTNIDISSDPNWPGFFWITSLLYDTDARREGRKKGACVWTGIDLSLLNMLGVL
jgi:hypothetical protein